MNQEESEQDEVDGTKPYLIHLTYLQKSFMEASIW